MSLHGNWKGCAPFPLKERVEPTKTHLFVETHGELLCVTYVLLSHCLRFFVVCLGRFPSANGCRQGGDGAALRPFAAARAGPPRLAALLGGEEVAAGAPQGARRAGGVKRPTSGEKRIAVGQNQWDPILG